MVNVSSPPSSVVAAGTWTSGANVYTSNDVYATNIGSVQNTDYPLDVGGFNFASIPAGSTINNVSVFVEAKTGTASRATLQIQLLDGGASLGLGGANTLTAADAGYTLTPVSATLAQLQSANLKVRVINRRTVSQASTTSVDFVRIDVTYTAPVTHQVSGTVAVVTGASGAVTNYVPPPIAGWPTSWESAWPIQTGFPIPEAGLAFWVDASTLSGADGSSVTSWPDLSGNGRTLASNLTTHPTLQTNELNGKSVVRFNGVDNRFSTAVQGSFNHFFLVAKCDRTTFNEFDGLLTSPTVLILGGVQGAATFYPQSQTAYYKDGVSYPTSAMPAPMAAWAHLSVTKSTPWASFAVQIGYDRNIGGRTWEGDVAEVIGYDHVLSDFDRRLVEDYLYQKWFVAPPAGTVHQVSGTVAVSTETSGDVLVTTPAVIHQVSGTVAVSTAAAGAVSSIQRVAGIVPVVAGAVGAVSSIQQIAGVAPVATAAAGAVRAILSVAGTIPVVVGASGSPGLLQQVSGTIPVVTTAAGAISVVVGSVVHQVSGTVNIGVGVIGDVSRIQQVAGTAAVVTGAVGDVSVISGAVIHQVSGTVAVTTAAFGTASVVVGSVTHQVSGVVAVTTGTPSADLSRIQQVAGVIPVVTTAQGVVSQRHAVSGAVAVVTTAAGTVIRQQQVSGTVVVVSSTLGAVSSRQQVSGVVDVVSRVFGNATVVGQVPVTNVYLGDIPVTVALGDVPVKLA